MDKKTQKITTGAAVIAIFAIMILINRQTGSMFEEMFLFLFPIPMVAFAAKYGWKSSLPVLVGMSFFSFLFGTITTVFYAVSEAIIGIVLGEGIYRKADQTKTMMAVMGLSAVANVLNTIVFAELFGFDLEQDIAEIQRMMDKVMEVYSGTNMQEQIAALVTTDYVKQMLVISMVFLGIIQGFLIYQISILILRRLQFKIPKPKSIYLYFPPKWTAYLAVACLVGYNILFAKRITSGTVYNIMQAAQSCGDIYLVFFGMLGIMFYFRFYRNAGKIPGLLLAVVCLLTFQVLLFGLGFCYIVTSFHRRVAEEKGLIEKAPEEGRITDQSV